MAWDAPNRGRKSYIVKTRERVEWTTQTIKGPRRVFRRTPWKAQRYLGDLASARQTAEEMKKRDSLRDVAVFYEGKRVWT